MSVAELLASGALVRDVPLGPMTTYRFGGPAAWFAEPTDGATLFQVLEAADDLGLAVVVLGRGSNVVISERGLDAVVIRLSGSFARIDVDERGIVDAGAAAPLAKVARESVEHDRGGLEFLVGIPGSVGGAVRMNAGCFGSETADWMISARVLDLETRETTTRTPDQLEMAYRYTNLEDGELVLAARFRSEPRPAADGKHLIREVTQWRRQNQPGGTLNAGSVFKNPEGDAAGRIIDALGLKGSAVGGVRVSPRHANFFEAGEGATAQDVYDLMRLVQRRVRDETGVRLVPEVKFLGSFREAGTAAQ